MKDNNIIALLKIDLQISASSYDALLQGCIDAAREALTIEGITLQYESDHDNMLVVQYAAYLFRKRKENVPMSRMLRWQINNRLLSEKMRGDSND